MQINASRDEARACSGDALVVPVFADGSLPDVTAQVAVAAGLDFASIAGRFRLSRPGDFCWVPATGSLRCDDIALVCVGGGAAAGTTRADLRMAATRYARKAGRRRLVCALGNVPAEQGDAWELVTEAMIIGAYRFDRYRTEAAEDAPASIDELIFPGASEASVAAGSAIGRATNMARDLVNMTPGELTPEAFASFCEEQSGSAGFTCRVIGSRQLQEEGFGGITAVGAGSDSPPALVCLESGDRSRPATALVGKGITFDSGGLDLKQLSWMLQMKDDMAGAAAIVAALAALPPLGLSPHVRAYLALAENAVGSRSVRPGDVIRHRDGRTSEVVSPDAEGRLVLADALCFAREQSPERIIDVATLTGSTGLGPQLWGVMGNSQQLVDSLLRSGREAGEPGWQLPLWDGYRESLRSQLADMRNLALGEQWNHAAIWGGLYLSQFVGDRDWAHLDIGATALRVEPDRQWPAGATGSGTRTLIELFRATEAGELARGGMPKPAATPP
jgi:leucyl aminopeptidase